MGFTQSKLISIAVSLSYSKYKGFIIWSIIYYKNRKPLANTFWISRCESGSSHTCCVYRKI